MKEYVVLTAWPKGGISMRFEASYGAAMNCYTSYCQNQSGALRCYLIERQGEFTRNLFEFDYKNPPRDFGADGGERFNYRFGKPMPFNEDTKQTFLAVNSIVEFFRLAAALPDPVLTFECPTEPIENQALRSPIYGDLSDHLI